VHFPSSKAGRIMILRSQPDRATLRVRDADPTDIHETGQVHGLRDVRVRVKLVASDDIELRLYLSEAQGGEYQPEPSASNGRPKILSVGRLSEKKGLVYLVRACRILKDQGYDFTCHIVGEGPQRSELHDLIGQLSLEDTVILRGTLPHEEVIENYRQATLFVLPCIKSKDGDMDGIPNVLAEAMAMQLPVVSTDISGIPELVDNQVNGLLVPSGDGDALATAMARLLDDPALREKLAQNGRQSIGDTFDVNRNVRKFAATLWPDWFQN